MSAPTIIWSHKDGGLMANVLEYPGGTFVLHVRDMAAPTAKAMKREFDTREAAVIAGVKACKKQTTGSDT